MNEQRKQRIDKQQETRSSDSEAKLRAILDNAAEGIVTIDRNGIVESMNGSAEKIFGYDAEQVLGQNVKMLMPSPFRQDHDDYISNYVQTGERKIIGIGREVVGRRADGSTFAMHLAVSEIWLNDQWYFTGIVHDISERKQAEEALARSEARLRAVLETAVEGIVVIDKSGTIESVNPAAEQMFGYSEKDLIRQNVKVLMPSPFREAHDEYLSNYSTTGTKKIIGIGREVVGLRSDGTTFPLYLSVAEMQLDGESYFTGIVRDLTDLKESHERLLQAERLAAIGQMMTTISHESRNYLQRISSSTEMLQFEVEGNAEATQDLANVLSATQSLAQLLGEIRSFAAPIKLETATYCVASIWRQVWSDLATSRGKRHVAIHEVLNDVETRCEVDAFRLHQVFRNIFENAIAACEDPVQIEVFCSCHILGEKPAIQVSIRDNGPGLNPDQREHVFDAFFTTKTKGTGLGMSIAKRVVEAHGGQIAVGSETAGGGAEFVITLPRVARSESDG